MKYFFILIASIFLYYLLKPTKAYFHTKRMKKLYVRYLKKDRQKYLRNQIRFQNALTVHYKISDLHGFGDPFDTQIIKDKYDVVIGKHAESIREVLTLSFWVKKFLEFPQKAALRLGIPTNKISLILLSLILFFFSLWGIIDFSQTVIIEFFQKIFNFLK